MLQLLKGSYKADDLYFLQNILENGLDSACSNFNDVSCSNFNDVSEFQCRLCPHRNVCASVQRLANYAGQIADSMMKESK